MNGGKDVKFGDDRRFISIIPNNDQLLYNIANGEQLNDEFGAPLITEVDTFYTEGASRERSTSIVHTNQAGEKIIRQTVSIATTIATYLNKDTNIVGIATTNPDILVGDLVSGPTIPEATIVSRVGIGSIIISNNITNEKIYPGLRSRRYSGYFGLSNDPPGTVAAQDPTYDNVNYTDNLTPVEGPTYVSRFDSFFAGSLEDAPYYNNSTWLIDGYFLPKNTGSYTFFLNSDDASYLWIGNNALQGYTKENALVQNGGIHGALEVSASISLTAGVYYPIRIIYGNQSIPTAGNPTVLTVAFNFNTFFSSRTPTPSGWFNVSNPSGAWSDFMDLYAVYPSSTLSLENINHTTSWNISIPVGSNYTLTLQADNFGSITIDGILVAESSNFSPAGEKQVTVFLSEGNHQITALVSNALGIPPQLNWINNPAGIAWTLQPQKTTSGYDYFFSIDGTIKIHRIISTKTIPDIAWKIEEQFKETSEVSTTLLGIERAETQLSLFSNVSSYGLDKDDFELYSFNFEDYSYEWQNRINQIYGNRYLARSQEEVTESAIRLESFPVPYTFPFGPVFEDAGLYNENLFNRYLNFIDMGNQLDSYFRDPERSEYPDSWKEKFLPVGISSVFGSDVNYSAGITTSFAQIDTWTDTWRDIRDNQLRDPITFEIFDFTKVSEIFGNSNYTRDNTQPGYSNTAKRYSLLQSRRVFRYQPGRISGFTFGTRTSVEVQPGSVTEWGISNPTDQYFFRVENGQFYIVRRSTIPLDRLSLERSGLTLADQIREKTENPFDETLYWTIKIPRDKFNGDPLNSNGPSGYLLQPEKVTMYKIEFGWYGAIGARFYVYIPTDNGDARWVAIHTLVIENSLGAPCLQDSYFRFTYILSISNTRDLRTPQFLYKYGASYYIDGGDDGTAQIYSVSSKQKQIKSTSTSSIIGIKPKDIIVSSVGAEIVNKKQIIPRRLNVFTDSLTEVKIVSCSACPGFGHAYTPGVATTENGRYCEIEFTSPSTIEAIGISSFTLNDIGAKIVAPSIYNAYIAEFNDDPDENGNYFEAEIHGFRKVFDSILESRNIGGKLVLDRSVGISTIIPILSPYPHQIRLSQYNAYFASDFEFNGSKIEIQFVNPDINEYYSHFTDFLIGITDQKPIVEAPNRLVEFQVGAATTTVLNNSQILYQEATHTWASIDEDGIETGEGWGISVDRNPPRKMGIDYRIPRLRTPSPGICSKLTIDVLDPIEISDVYEFNYRPDLENTPGLTVDSRARIWIQVLGSFPDIDYDGGQIAIMENGTIIETQSRFVGKVTTYTDSNGNSSSYIQISQRINIDSGATIPIKTSPYSIIIRPITATSIFKDNELFVKSKLFNYNPYPLYLVGKLRDYAEINNISVREIIGDFQRTISPILYVSDNSSVTLADGNTDNFGTAPTNFQEVVRTSAALVDTQNQQKLRPFSEKDTLYIGKDSTKHIDMKTIFGPDRNVITPDNNNIEAFFITAKKIDDGDFGTIEMSINYNEQ